MPAVNFAPQSRREVRALLKYISAQHPDTDANKSAEYNTEVSAVKQSMREYYDADPAQAVVQECPWQLTGATARCEAIARRYSVPVWDVVAEANPSS